MIRWCLVILMMMALVGVVSAEGSRNAAGQYCVSSTCFDGETRIGAAAVPLRGAGTLRWWGFRVYSAAFYTANRNDPPEVFLGKEPHRLVLQYYREISARDIVKATEMSLDKNPALDRAAVQPSFDRINALYVDVRKGDQYELVYEPGVGTSLVYNGTVVDTVAGEDFARALFGIWLSPYTLSTSLREKLLTHR